MFDLLLDTKHYQVKFTFKFRDFFADSHRQIILVFFKKSQKISINLYQQNPF